MFKKPKKKLFSAKGGPEAMLSSLGILGFPVQAEHFAVGEILGFPTLVGVCNCGIRKICTVFLVLKSYHICDCGRFESIVGLWRRWKGVY